MQRFLDGCHSASEIYELSPSVFRDAMLAGTWIFSFDADVGCQSITARRVLPLELLVDSIEAVDGNSRTLFRIRFEDKDDLIEKYPRCEDEIESAPTFGPDEFSGTANADRVIRNPRSCRVVYAWKKATRDEDGNVVPGRHIVAVNGVALEDEEWEYDYFPLSFFHWRKPVRGF